MERFTSFGPGGGGMVLRRGAARGGAGVPQGSTPIFFLTRQKENGRGRSKEKTLRTNRRTACSCVRGSCESVRRRPVVPSSLRLSPALEELGSRITTAAERWGGRRICRCFSFRAFRAAPAVAAGPYFTVGADGGSVRCSRASPQSHLPWGKAADEGPASAPPPISASFKKVLIPY